MRDWLTNLVGEQYVAAVLWTAAALVALVVVLALVRIFRGLNSGTFVAGGRNRKTRLAVMDATAIDSQRRLVLVRRDDVEHLLLIGGPTDVVVEQDIRLMAQRRPAPVEAPRAAPDFDEPEMQFGQPAPRNSQAARPVEPVQPPRPAPVAERAAARPAPPVSRPADRALADRALSDRAPAEPRTAPQAAAPPRQAPTQPMPSVRPAPRPPVSAAPANGRGRPADQDSLEETLMNELDLAGGDLGGESPVAAPKPKPQESSLDDEMARLLGELANPRR